MELGADGVELDVHTTSDGMVVVHHDSDVAGLGPIGRLTYQALLETRLPNGESIPTLAEALEILQGLDVYVEVKRLPPERDAMLLAVLDAGPEPARYAIHSFDHHLIRRLARLRPRLPLGILLSARTLAPERLMEEAGATTLWQQHEGIDAALVEQVHAGGGRVIAWTVNTEADGARLAGFGVDGLCGNYIDRLRAAARGSGEA